MKKPIYWLLFAVTFLISLLPLKLLYCVSDLISFVFMRVFSYRKSVIYTNLARSFPELKYDEIKRVAKEFQRNLVDIFIEAIWSMSKSPRKIISRIGATIGSIDSLNDGLMRGNGVVLAMGHQANWELLGVSYYITDGTDISCKVDDIVSVYKRQSNGPVDMLLNYIRTKHGATLVESGDIVRYLIKNKTSNKVYLFIADQSPAQVSGEKFAVNFLNQKTYMFKGPEYVARKFDMPIYYMDMKRAHRGRYVVDLKLISMNPTETQEGEITSTFAKMLENSIHEDKSTWLWSHKRWKLIDN